MISDRFKSGFSRFGLSLIPVVITLSSGCSSPPIDQINLMPAPDVYGNGILNPLPEKNPFDLIPYDGILFATDRLPATDNDPQKYYKNEVGYLVRLGLAEIQLGEKELDWQYVRKNSMLKTRPDNLPIRITKIEEWGAMPSTSPFWLGANAATMNGAPDASGRFAEAINSQLAHSPKKHVYIYVHGYKVPFENPLLVSAELWHFLGYNGAFIAYSWPSTPSRFAYIRDSDTSVGFARNFRLLLELVAEQTDAEQIHIIGYSNGTRLVVRALEQLALMNHGKTPEEIQEKLRIQNVILTGSDLDRNTFGIYIADGILDVAQRTTVYVSGHDKALAFAQRLTRRHRVGQLWGGKGDLIHPQTVRALTKLQERINYVDVSQAEGADQGKGHGYFRGSPWASSDILMTLYFGLDPQERGLVEQEGLPIYSFPPDYISRLWKSIGRKDAAFAEKHRRHMMQLEAGKNASTPK
ncbi:alpha/beta hydrolase [Pontiella sulfatireligans]|uniref:Alpha/beta hydrolase n=1 Tax=Pontiella sulfatireligans TaxID=2750658 RepID=A0A6C2UMX7_9BACT|nr:alpha/beta hydrolase [Pontiella sulfatireligans]VGO21632.1 hypothetical protein SCARR_03706 [Pontiella sulfatireligans]